MKNIVTPQDQDSLAYQLARLVSTQFRHIQREFFDYYINIVDISLDCLKNIFANCDPQTIAAIRAALPKEEHAFTMRHEDYLTLTDEQKAVFAKQEKWEPVKLNEKANEPEKPELTEEEKKELAEKIWRILWNTSFYRDRGYDKIKALMKEGMNLHRIDSDGDKLVFLESAVRWKSPKLFRLFLEYGADIHEKDFEGESGYSTALKEKEKGDPTYWDILCEFHPELKEEAKEPEEQTEPAAEDDPEQPEEKEEETYHVGQYFLMRGYSIYRLIKVDNYAKHVGLAKQHDNFYLWEGCAVTSHTVVDNPDKITQEEFRIITCNRPDWFIPISKEEALERLKTLD